MAQPINIARIPVTIANSTALSPEVDIGAQQLVGIAMPAAWNAAALTFQVSVDGVTWIELQNASGVETYTAAAGQYIAVTLANWRGITALKVRSGTAGSPVNQGAGCTLTLICRVVT